MIEDNGRPLIEIATGVIRYTPEVWDVTLLGHVDGVTLIVWSEQDTSGNMSPYARAVSLKDWHEALRAAMEVYAADAPYPNITAQEVEP